MLLAAALLAGIAGCGPGAPVRPDVAGVTPQVRYDGLEYVLAKAQNDKGMLDRDDLLAAAPRLDEQLRLLAVTGPTATPQLLPTPGDRLAYWYNARAAWSMKLALLADCPRELPAGQLERRPFLLDGRMMTLEQIDALLGDDPDWRVAVAAPSVRMHQARLPGKPLDAAGIADAVAQRFLEYVDDDQRFIIDVDTETILFPPAFWRIGPRLIEQYDRTYRTRGANLITALLPHVGGSPLRRLQDAIGYRPVQDSADGPLACLKH